jgi:N-acetylmuramoyl-L-alanine amidase
MREGCATLRRTRLRIGDVYGFRTARQMWVRSTTRRMVALSAIGCAAALVVGISVAAAGPARKSTPAISDERQKQFAAAASEFGVPTDVLLATSYALTGWSASNAPGSFGPMGLTDVTAADWTARLAGTGRDATAPAVPAGLAASPGMHSLAAAAKLTGASVATVKSDPAQNIRAGAALLAAYAKQASGGTMPSTVVGWYGAVARFGTGDSMTGRAFADSVMGLLRTGVAQSVVKNQRLALGARQGLTVPGAPRLPTGFSAADAAECPASLTCTFVPAADATNGPGTASYGNFDTADRPADGTEVRYLVVGDAGAGAAAAVAAAQDATTERSPHYVVDVDGTVTQLVRDKDVAWHAGNWSVNVASIGIDVVSGPAGYTAAEAKSVGALAAFLGRKFGIPLDRQHLLGHDEIARGTAAAPMTTTTGDLRPGFSWTGVLAAAGAPVKAEAFRPDRIATIASAAPVTLRTSPAAGAPAAGTAATGQKFAVTGKQGDWIGVWFGGKQAWIDDPTKKLVVGGDGSLVTPLAGSVPIYAAAAPEASAYPAGTTVPALTPVATMPAGQSYFASEPVAGQDLKGAFGIPQPITILGSSQWLMITFDHRQGFVNAEDVEQALPAS